MQLRERGADGELHCHLSMGGRMCSLPRYPTVLPSWYSSAYLPPSALGPLTLSRHPGKGISPDIATAPTVTIPLVVKKAESVVGAEAESAADRRCNGELNILSEGIVPVLRAATTTHASAPILEVGINGHIPRCAAKLSTEILLQSETARLAKLRTSCDGYFAPPGSHRGELGWIHRHRLPRRGKRRKGR